MSRAIALVVIVGALVALMAGTALAVAESGGPGNDNLVGTNKSDSLAGNGGDDDIFGLAGKDAINGGDGDDDLFGGADRDTITGDAGSGDGGEPTITSESIVVSGPGDDFIDDGNDGVRDTISCGPGDDTVKADPIDLVANDCEDVTRR